MTTDINEILTNEDSVMRLNHLNELLRRELITLIGEHRDTRVGQYKNVIEFVASNLSDKYRDEIMSLEIMETTGRAVRAAVRTVSSLAIDLDPDMSGVEIEYLSSCCDSAKRACGFYCTLSKQIVVIRDHLHLLEDPDDRPDRYSKDEWQQIRNRCVVAHEIFHFYLDRRSGAQDDIYHERCAYGGMIDCCIKEGLKKDEIIDNFLLTFGRMVVMDKIGEEIVDMDDDELEEMARKYTVDLYDSYTKKDSTPHNVSGVGNRLKKKLSGFEF